MVLTRLAPARPLIAPGWFPRWLKPLVFVLALSPLLWFALRLVLLRPGDPVGINPIETAIRFSGDQALTLLLVSLAVSPLRHLTGWAAVMRLRRMLGLFAFFYAAVHLLVYAGLDQFFDWATLWADVLKRRYITVGMAALLILLALAVTSPQGMVKRLGGWRWKRLHALVYFAAPLAVLHYAMMVKADLRTPLIYAGVLAVLLLLRSPWRGMGVRN